MKNEEIRIAAKEADIKLWEVAEKMGMHDSCFSRKLRKELSASEKEKILRVINELHTERLNAVVERMKEEGVLQNG